jgi:hypothetical protein
MTQLLKFRKRSKVPAVKRNEVVLFVDQDGTLKRRDDNGDVSEIGGGGGNPTPPVTLTGTDGATRPLTVVGSNDQSADFLRVAQRDGQSALQIQADGLGNATTIVLRTHDPGLGGLIRFLSDEYKMGTIDATDTTLGFFGAAPVVQQAHPVTLDDVIAVLVAFGLVAA